MWGARAEGGAYSPNQTQQAGLQVGTGLQDRLGHPPAPEALVAGGSRAALLC